MPLQEERTETSISLRLLKPKVELRDHMVLSLEVRAHGEGAWREAVADAPAALVTVSGLQPGTKYVFRSRGGMEDPDGKLVWGDYSAESVYPTLGNPPATAHAGGAPVAASPGLQSQRKGGKGAKGGGRGVKVAATALAAAGDQQQRPSKAAQEAEREVRCECLCWLHCAPLLHPACAALGPGSLTTTLCRLVHVIPANFKEGEDSLNRKGRPKCETIAWRFEHEQKRHPRPCGRRRRRSSAR